VDFVSSAKGGMSEMQFLIMLGKIVVFPNTFLAERQKSSCRALLTKWPIAGSIQKRSIPDEAHFPTNFISVNSIL